MKIFSEWRRKQTSGAADHSRGVLYIAFGDLFLKEVAFSAESLKKYNPDLHTTIFTDQEVSSELFDERHLVSADPRHRRHKVDFIGQSPYERTLFLDTDTIINHRIDDLFELLDVFDLVAAHDLARKRLTYSNVMPEYKEIPYAFSEINTGVMAFRKNALTDDLFRTWHDTFYKFIGKCQWDQPSMRISLWQSCQRGLRLYIVPVEYNLRSRAVREKNRRLHEQFGEDHLKPRIYHIHADPRINTGTYDVGTMEEALARCREHAMDY